MSTPRSLLDNASFAGRPYFSRSSRGVIAFPRRCNAHIIAFFLLPASKQTTYPLDRLFLDAARNIQQSQTFCKNVLRGVYVSVVMRATVRARPFPVFQLKFFPTSTDATCLRCICGRRLDKYLAKPLAFIIQRSEEMKSNSRTR